MTHVSSDPQAAWFLNGRVVFHRSAADGPDGVAICEQRLPFGDSPPLHRHHHEDEVFQILEGVVRFRVGESEVLARAGDTLVGPKGVPHTFRVESPEGARMLTFTRGGDFERMVRTASRPAETDGLPPATAPTPAMQQALAEVCAANAIDILGPPLAA